MTWQEFHDKYHEELSKDLEQKAWLVWNRIESRKIVEEFLREKNIRVKNEENN